MTLTQRGRLLSRIRWTGALTAVAALVAIVALPGVARAEGPGNDSVSGNGATDSQVQVNWTQGILDNTNAPIASANQDRTNKSSEWWFIYQQFQNLQVTVSQTQNIGLQGISVSWTGATPSFDQFGDLQSFMQIMECYGDATTGPTPEQCEFGSNGLLETNSNLSVASRTGPLCVTAAPSLTNPPAGQDGSGPALGCDPQEPGTGTDHLAPCPGTDCTPGDFTIPFAPVSDPTKLDYDNGSTTYYSQFNTNEIQQAFTNTNGAGQQEFETLTNTQSSGLGCGKAESNGQPAGCWLVLVPRGVYEPNGLKANVGAAQSIQSSPLGATNWAQRIQVHLSYAPLPVFCPISTQERATEGTQVITSAVQSWQLALNQVAKCSKVYGFSASPETTSTTDLSTPSSGIGLAFTTIPIGSEATRSGGSPPSNLPTILYAPVAITALGFGFNINRDGFDATPVKLTPLLLAKALTQSYRQDLPSFYPAGGAQGPTWAQKNPLNISTDPTFQSLNGTGTPAEQAGPVDPLLAEDHSGLNQQAWQWIQGSSAAKTWLGGTADASDGNMAVDPDFQALNLGSGSAPDTFARSVSGDTNVPCLNIPDPESTETITRCTLDLIPYINNFDDASADVLAANNPNLVQWVSGDTSPQGKPGWWRKAGVEPAGNDWMWAFDDTSNMTHFGLTPAQLCDDSGQNCVGPTDQSLTAALASAKPDSSGLLHVDPASPGTNGYPLVDVVYAAVPTDQSAAALTDYASLISYAAGTGQTPGVAAGDLPPGYLPLTPALQSQAQAVVTQLQTLATASPSPSPSASSSSSPASPTPAASTTSPGGGNLGGNGSTTPASTTGSSTTATTGTSSGTGGSGGQGGGATHSAAPAPSPGPTLPGAISHPTPKPGALPSASTTHAAGGPVISMPPATQAASATQGTPIGTIRWVLIAVMIAGGACAAVATLLRTRFSFSWLARSSPGATPTPPTPTPSRPRRPRLPFRKSR